jgi:dienelactone hydrolase
MPDPVPLLEHVYRVDGVTLTGFLADGSAGVRVPGVLVAHEAPGVTRHVKERARMLAECGYVAFALDLYGQGELPLEEARRQSQRLMSEPGLLRRRARAALEVLAAHPHCDATRLAAVGFCLGGIAALELARAGAAIRCAVGFHPGLKRPAGSETGPIAARVLVMIGEDDPIVPSEDRTAFVEEMTKAGADWQLHVFGGVGHSYTNRDIDALGYPRFGYDERADRRAWGLMLSLFEEVLAR